MTVAAGENFDVQRYLARERRAIDATGARLMAEWLDDGATPVAAPICYALEAGGKRLRPILCVAAYRAVHGARGGAEPGMSDLGPEGLYEIAYALELIHTYSLVHDDLPCMDDDDLRRGRPTTHRAFDEARAIIAGAALIPLAARAAERGARRLGLSPDERSGLVRELLVAAGAGGMVGGQWLDLKAEGRSLDVDALESIHRRKTGALLAASPRLGGRAARAEARVLDALGAYGSALGLAFQIADDVLDLTGDTAALGKTAGRDAVLAKATYPALLGVDRARERARLEADRAIEALRQGGIASVELEALAHYAVERDR